MKKRVMALLVTGALCAMGACSLVGCSSATTASVDAGDVEGMYQVATLQSLMQGYYEPAVTVGDLKTHGDTGLGTFEHVDGEMIVLDGEVYQALNTGEVKQVPDGTGVPFASVAFLKSTRQRILLTSLICRP